MQVTIPVKPIFGVQNALRSTICITFDWMTVYSSNSVDIWYLSSFSREVRCGKSWWQSWSFWKFKCSHTIMLKEWPGCLISSKIRGSWPLSAISISPPVFLFSSSFLYLSYPMLHHRLPRSHYWLEHIALQQLFCEGSCVWFWLPPADIILPKGNTGLHSSTMWYGREYILCLIGEFGVLRVCLLLLAPPVGYVPNWKCTSNVHWVSVVIIEIWTNLPLVLWCFRLWIQIGPGGGQYTCCMIGWSWCHFSHVVRH